MCPARDRHSRWCVCLEKHRQDRLRNQRHATSRPDVEMVVAALDLARDKLQLAGTNPNLRHLRTTDFRNGLHAREVLPLQPRLLATRANLLDPHRLPSDRAQRQRSAQNLPTALTLRSVNLYKVRHPLSLSPCPHAA